MCKEEWKMIPGFEGLYMVSNFGRVKSLNFHNTGKDGILKLTTNKKGYLCVSLHKEKKIYTFKVHRLVAMAFIPNPNNLPEVNHINEDKTNNCVDNLEWCDRKYNCNYGTGIKRKQSKRKRFKTSVTLCEYWGVCC